MFKKFNPFTSKKPEQEPVTNEQEPVTNEQETSSKEYILSEVNKYKDLINEIDGFNFKEDVKYCNNYISDNFTIKTNDIIYYLIKNINSNGIQFLNETKQKFIDASNINYNYGIFNNCDEDRMFFIFSIIEIFDMLLKYRDELINDKENLENLRLNKQFVGLIVMREFIKKLNTEESSNNLTFYNFKNSTSLYSSNDTQHTLNSTQKDYIKGIFDIFLKKIQDGLPAYAYKDYEPSNDFIRFFYSQFIEYFPENPENKSASTGGKYKKRRSSKKITKKRKQRRHKKSMSKRH